MSNNGKREFTVENAYQYNHKNATRWLFSHVMRYWWFVVIAVVLSLLNSVGQSAIAYYTGEAFDLINQPNLDRGELLTIVLYIFGLGVIFGLAQWGRNLAMEFLAQRTEREGREELYVSLLGKSQTFHDRQRIGDIMARATDDVRQVNFMINPGVMLLLGSGVFLIVPIISIALLRFELLLAPILFIIAFTFALRDYTKRLNPVAVNSRMSFGRMNAGLQETISGIEVVKSSAQEEQERKKFMNNAHDFRNYFVAQGNIEARYLPLLLLSIGLAGGFLHAMILYHNGEIQIGTIVAYMGMFGLLRFPTFISIFTFSLVQLGYAGAKRILELINDVTDLDENPGGYRGTMEGDITFENVCFGYEEDNPVIHDVSFTVKRGQTVAIVGQTGSGKSTITKLLNRIYDTSKGRVLIDGIDVREWSLDSLRSQISTIEQDIFLFTRTVAENIAFGHPGADDDHIQRASRDSQSFDFIENFESGFDTKIGERGVTLSGGQRQRIALARAFLTDPRILILDDSTSAIDSATEDEIQKAIRRAQEGRTVLLITHRLSQIRWADLILLVKQGRVVAQGTHEDLLAASEDYRRIFARYDIALPTLQEARS
jgi:ATP-binding cassette subfamily B protein